ncbi:MAG: hypothetical protein AB2A00_32160 [Myxococcota bacterium]
MRRFPSRGLLWCVLALWPVATWAASQQQDQAAQNAAAVAKAVKDDAGKRGITLVGPMLTDQDLDGDAKPDVVSAGKNPEGEIVLSVWKAQQNRAVHLWTSPPTGGDELRSLELRNMVGDKRAEMVLELIEHSPDETRRKLHVFRSDEAGLREVLRLGYPEATPDEIKSLERVSYGEDKPGYRISDLEGDGNQEVMIRREPKLLRVKGRQGNMVTLVVGVRESVYAWDARAEKGGKYVEAKDRFHNFLPGRKPTRISASSQKLPPDLAKQEQDRALEASFNQAFDSENAIDAGPLNDDPTPVEVNPAPRAFWAADNNLDTAWVENTKGAGEGEWVGLDFGDRQEINMVRVVPTCVENEAAVKNTNDLTGFSLMLSGAQRIAVDRSEKEPSDSSVLAVVEMPVPERKFAPQVLVFLQPGTKTSSLKLVVDKVKRRGKTNDTCVAELSVH